MKILRLRSALLCTGLVAAVAGFGVYRASAQQSVNYITGVVQGDKGPEAGVWVIAETKDLLTNLIKIVVTDDRGRFALPDLPSNASYKVWVRGYGLVDSTPITTKPTATAVTLKVNSAKSPAEAAKVYPGNYWLSLHAPPDQSLFPGTGAKGNGIGTRMLTQEHWVN